MPYLFRYVVVHGADGAYAAPQYPADLQGHEHAGFLRRHFRNNMPGRPQVTAVSFYIMLNNFSCQLHILIFFGQPVRFHFVADNVISLQKMAAVIRSCRTEQGDPVANAEGAFIT